MELADGWNNSLFKVLSSKKTSDNRAAIRRKLERIRQKLRSGARLTPAEKQFLRQYAPQLYEKAMAIERERAAYEERLKRCRTEEELERVKLEKMAEMAAADKEDEETLLARMAQMEEAEKEAAKEIFLDSEELNEEIAAEDFEEEYWNTETDIKEKTDWYDEASEEEYQKEAYEDIGIYEPPWHQEADRNTDEGYEELFEEFDTPANREAAFVRGHAAYRKAAQAEGDWIDEDYEEPFEEFDAPVNREPAFVRGHAAYRKAAQEEADWEEEIWTEEYQEW